ncbi:MAG: hypothetical protein JWP81_4790 [Ferruginibacter sp.]|nr:hypothetical protein [Ferruginibacter sp.]
MKKRIRINVDLTIAVMTYLLTGKYNITNNIL